jgi:predicted permease
MLNDLRYAVRTLLKNPGFTAVAVVTLAVGIGANTAIFSVVNGVLLRPLPYPDAERIVHVWTATADEARSTHSAGDFIDIQRENRSLVAIAGYRGDIATALARPGLPIQFEAAYVTIDFFDVLGTPAAAGRTFTRTVDAVPGERLVVLSHSAWQELYGGERSAVGQRLRLNGEPHTVLGVMPPEFAWPAGARLWTLSQKPVPPSPIDQRDAQSERDIRYFQAIARVKPGVTFGQAEDDLNRVSEQLRQKHPQTSEGRVIRLARLREEIVGDVRLALLVLQGAVGVVLLIACANVSSLLIARATARRRELAIRAALGAGRGRLIRQLLTESMALGICGGAAGLLLGAWLTVLIVRILPESVPRAANIEMDRVVSLVTIGIALLTGVLFGVMPALQASDSNPGSALKTGGDRSSTARARARAALVVAEIALTLVLLVGAGLLINSFLRLQRVASGLQPENVTVANVGVPQSRYPTGAQQTALYGRLVEALARHPEVQSVAVGFPGPLRGSNASGTFYIEGRTSESRADRPFAHVGTVSGGYFAAMGIPLLSGRTFTASDDENAPGVAVVSASLARKYWPGENPIGKHLRFEDDPKAPWVTVVGVCGDFRQLGLHEAPPTLLFFPYEQFPLPFTDLVVRSTAPEGTIASLVRAELGAIDPELPPGEFRTLPQILSRSVDEPRFRTFVLGAFAVMALLLASVGVYGLISYSVTQRTREIGIRVALGAQPRHVLLPVIKEGFVLAASGIAIGLAGALMAARVLSTFLFGIGATDPATFAFVAALLFGIALLASYVPSRRALRVDPITSLRSE